MVHVKNPQDLGASAMLLLIGIGGLWFGREYQVGTTSRMGPGYMPMALSWGLIIFSAIIGLRSVRMGAAGVKGPPIEPIVLRTNLLIIGAIVSFAVLIRWAGLAPATFAVTLLSALASRESAWKETLVVAVLLSALCVFVFIYALRQSMPVFGG